MARAARAWSEAPANNLPLALLGTVAGSLLIAAILRLPQAGNLLAADGLARAAATAATSVAVLALLGAVAPAARVARMQPSEVLRDA